MDKLILTEDDKGRFLQYDKIFDSDTRRTEVHTRFLSRNKKQLCPAYSDTESHRWSQAVPCPAGKKKNSWNQSADNMAGKRQGKPAVRESSRTVLFSVHVPEKD